IRMISNSPLSVGEIETLDFSEFIFQLLFFKFTYVTGLTTFGEIGPTLKYLAIGSSSLELPKSQNPGQKVSSFLSNSVNFLSELKLRTFAKIGPGGRLDSNSNPLRVCPTAIPSFAVDAAHCIKPL